MTAPFGPASLGTACRAPSLNLVVVSAAAAWATSLPERFGTLTDGTTA